MKTILAAAAAVAATAFAGTASATPVLFDIDDRDYVQVGSGYGCEISSTKLCVEFNGYGPDPLPFSLEEGESETINFGLISMLEVAEFNNWLDLLPDIDGGETDNLGVTAELTFADPFSGTLASVSVVGVFTGIIADGAVDLSLSFDPVEMAFGNGGLFEVDFSDYVVTGFGNRIQNQTATITLISAPTEAVPEPALVGLFGLGLAGLGFARLRRR